MDSLFRRYYVPRLVLRQVKLGDKAIVREVVDGQQRIVTAQRFFADELRLPDSLRDVDGRLPGLSYTILPWVKGGSTVPWNGQVLCRLHNAKKGGR